MKLRCLQMSWLIERHRSGLSPGEGLRLEEHLAACSACRADANLLGGLTELASAEPLELSAAARTRAISSALSTEVRGPVERVVAPRRVGVMLIGAVAALALGVAILQREVHEPTSAVIRRELEATDRVLSGKVLVTGIERLSGERLAGEHLQLHANVATELALGHARVQLRADSDASWDGATRKLSLRRGSALIDVDPTRHRSFEVETTGFMVRVLGTRFEVTERSVQVLLGRVSVLPHAMDADSEPIVLAADSDQTRFELPAPTAGDAEPEPVAVRAPRSAPRRSPGNDQRVDAAALLERARDQLAARELKQAQATLDEAAPHLQDAVQRAQALSLEAEGKLLARRFGAARDTYLRVARKFGGMPAAETALFAAARIEGEHGEPARAAQLLRAYLAQYPQGSFVREAERRLRLFEQAAP